MDDKDALLDGAVSGAAATVAAPTLLPYCGVELEARDAIQMVTTAPACSTCARLSASSVGGPSSTCIRCNIKWVDGCPKPPCPVPEPWPPMRLDGNSGPLLRLPEGMLVCTALGSIGLSPEPLPPGPFTPGVVATAVRVDPRDGYVQFALDSVGVILDDHSCEWVRPPRLRFLTRSRDDLAFGYRCACFDSVLSDAEPLLTATSGLPPPSRLATLSVCEGCGGVEGPVMTGAQRAAFERQWERVEAMAEVPERELVRRAVLLEEIDEARRDRHAALGAMAEAAAAASAPEFRDAIFEDYTRWEEELDVTEEDAYERHVNPEDEEDEEAEWDGEEDADEFECWEGEGEDDEWGDEDDLAGCE